MAKINDTIWYDGAEAKMKRLGLEPLVDEVRQIIAATQIRLREQKHANGAAAVRKLIDGTFAERKWESKQSGDVDWMKCERLDSTKVCIGVEVQVSARSELLYKDVLHLRKRIVTGDIDLGVIIVPSDRMQSYLPDRTPSISYAKQVVREQDAEGLPIMLLEIEHDGPGPALKKVETNISRRARRTSKAPPLA